MSKKITSIIAFFIVFTCTAQKTEEQEKEKIKAVMQLQVYSWNTGDLFEYMNGYWNSDSLLFVGAKGPTYGWEQTLKNYYKSYPNVMKMGKLKFDFIQIEMLSNQSAFVVGKWTLNRTEDTLQGYFSLLWRKIEGEWKIVADHSSSSD